jgi:hypothetical protein
MTSIDRQPRLEQAFLPVSTAVATSRPGERRRDEWPLRPEAKLAGSHAGLILYLTWWNCP